MRRSEATRPSVGTRRTSFSSSLEDSSMSSLARVQGARAGELEPDVSARTRRFSSSAVPSATIRPRSRTAIRSASWSASSRYWVVRKIVTSLAARLADDLPHRATTPRIQAGCWFVEEDHPWIRRPESWLGRACRRMPPEYVETRLLLAASVSSNCSSNPSTRSSFRERGPNGGARPSIACFPCRSIARQALRTDR